MLWFIVFIMGLIALAVVGDWFYKFKHLNKEETLASIDEMETLLATLEIEKAKVGDDREKVHNLSVVIEHQAKRLRRLEKRLGEFEKIDAQ